MSIQDSIRWDVKLKGGTCKQHGDLIKSIPFFLKKETQANNVKKFNFSDNLQLINITILNSDAENECHKINVQNLIVDSKIHSKQLYQTN
jgi:hypothetical protein